ncbi:hypothetical protein QFC24_000957 [Naganishia onofrii]|uniref:Uncharacterized protein n=1 Tax=Naganishia onofrii TaxID=1851511 RepID=A0ACC2XV84_9TREE|nr:hypothetical protein QFC24_000957 [Naganishia onofrii]
MASLHRSFRALRVSTPLAQLAGKPVSSSFNPVRRTLATTVPDSSTPAPPPPPPQTTPSPPSSSQQSTASTSNGVTLVPWNPYSVRCGAIARKRGMTALWTDDGKRVPVTVLQFDNLQVISHRPPPPSTPRTPFNRSPLSPTLHTLQLGSSNTKSHGTRHITRQMLGHFKKAGVEPKKVVREFRVTPDAVLPVGAELSVAHFVPGQYVDVTADSIGKGFAGVMKRHNFAGLKASHGVSLTHRSAGSTGQHQDPGRVLPGKKMGGHMGTTRTTIQNLPVLRIDTALNLLFVKGNVPGFDDAYVMIKDSKKKLVWEGQRNVRKGLQQGEWLTGVARVEGKDAVAGAGAQVQVEGVKDLPVPGMTVQMVKEAGWPAVIEVKSK